MAVAWDGYAAGNYDVYLRRLESGRWSEVETVAGTPRFEANPTLAVDGAGRIWIAWEESGPEWGKDTGFLPIRQGTQLHESRTVAVACLLPGGAVSVARQRLTPSGFWELPHLQLDRAGAPYLFVRHLLTRQAQFTPGRALHLALWEIHAARYTGAGWSDLVRVPRSAGRNDMLPATALDSKGSMWLAWPTDWRSTKSFLPHQLQVHVGSYPADVAAPAAAQAGPLAGGERPSDSPSGTTRDGAIHPNERREVDRIRSYRIVSPGGTYSIFRGDLHRHTDISSDGNNDGALLEAYRYARDAAALDFVGVTDHNFSSGVDLPYNWWRSQKVADLFHVPKSFVTFYSYERSIEYPNGHRNIFFTQRGVPTRPLSQEEDRGIEGAEGLFWYLRRFNGFSIPHTTGRTSGTDWRDNDPAVESLLEIYQGMRDTYEYPGAPKPKRLWSDFVDRSKRLPAELSDEASPFFRRLGFAWNALAKGYKLGFIASSDHVSTHIAFACLIAKELTRESLLEAVRARRAYGATDNIILDVRFAASDGEHMMGEEFTSRSPVRIRAKVLGTGPIRQLDVIRNSRIVYTRPAGPAELEFEYREPEMPAGTSYYYVRVVQENGEMAWGSPVWVHPAR
jgi:hypothetical protein